MWADCAGYVTEQLSQFDPIHRSEFGELGNAYRKTLMEVDTFCRDQLATIPPDRRSLVTAHDAFAYFSQAYGLTNVALKGVSTEEEVDLGRMTEVVELVVRQKIPAVFVESAVSPKVVQAVVEPARQRGHEVVIGGELYADALGPEGSGADTYEGMMRANVNTIVTALGGAKQP
jgi:manganese/zinc/iron transport system substrate-binding protein